MTDKYTRKSANILLEAADLQERKGQDYNGAQTSVQQADYYPRGVWSILDIVNAKYLRMVSVLEQMEQGGSANFESVEDSAIDLINYASFLVAYMRGDVDGQEPGKDIFNRRISKTTHPTTALYPSKFRIEKTPQKEYSNIVAQDFGKIDAYLPSGARADCAWPAPGSLSND